MANVGIVHVHSNLSYDGRHTLAEIAVFAKRRGYSFVGMSEHSDSFDQQRMTHLVEECRRLSDPTFLMIPGLEFTCDDNLHLLALGIERFTDARDPVLVARFVRAQGGVAVLSHPSRYDFQIPPGLETAVNGIEIWNAAYDGRFLPNDRSMALWKALRTRNTSLSAFGAQDLHIITGHCHVKTVVPPDELKQETILRSLKEGNFIISNTYLRFRSLSAPGWIGLNSIRSMRRIYLTARAIRDRLAS